VLPRQYRDKMLGRADVSPMDDLIEWAGDEDALLDSCDALVLARRPVDQVAAIGKGLRRPEIGRYHLEKPIAPTPDLANATLKSLEAAGKGVGVGFIFRHTEWGCRCRAWIKAAPAGSRLQIDWRFAAHHFQTGIETWKRRPSQGGGAIRFYGIHLIALLAELGYRQVTWSRAVASDPDDLRAWRAEFLGPSLPDCEVMVDSDASDRAFKVRGSSAPDGGGLALNLGDPFEEAPALGGLDRRVAILTQECRDFLGGDCVVPSWYFASIDLWAAVETVTRIGLPAKGLGDRTADLRHTTI
jgi:hypothetical protein